MQKEAVMFSIMVSQYDARKNSYVPTLVEANIVGSQAMYTRFFRKWKSEFSVEEDGEYQVMLIDGDDDNVMDSFYCNDIDFI